MAPMGRPSFSIGTATMLRKPTLLRKSARRRVVVGVRKDVRNCLGYTAKNRTRCGAHPAGRDWIEPPKACKPFYCVPMGGGEVNELAVKTKYMAELRFAKPSRARCNCVEHRLNVSRRAADNV